MRRITLFVSAMAVALFVTATLPLSTARAQTVTVDGEWEAAAWDGNNLTYNEMTFQPAPSNSSLNTALQGTICQNRPVRYVYYNYETDDDPSTKVHQAVVICYSEGADKTKNIPGALVEFRDATSNGGSSSVSYGEHTREADITIAAQGTPSIEEGGQGTGSEDTITNCSSLHTKGLGWMICPLTNWLADGMDQLYNILSSFLIVSPLTTDRSGVLYYMWGIMQNLANVLFIVGFLIIIYSQITGAGLSNYGIKRLLPRLVIAAVLVNISYWISAVAVDLSNILGMSLQNMFIDVRDNIPASEVEQVGSTNWKAMALTVLSAGAASAGAVVGVAASAGASLWFLLVGLVGAMVSAMVAILVLAARQALITILVIISPLAFVAYLLPSTEKYFDRWRGLFTTMLVMFPIFSVVFGGASLAGVAIIYSADPQSNNYYNIVILGMLVQVAPVVITPLLIKLSGSLLGRIAGIVNDPNKGIIDKTRKFAQDRHDYTKNRQIWDKDKDGNYRYNNPLALAGRRMALRGEHRSQQVKSWEGGLAAAYTQDERYFDTYSQGEINSKNKNIGEQTAKRNFAQETARRDALRILDTTSRVTQDEAADAENKNKTFYEAMQAKPSSVDPVLRDVAHRAHAIHEASLDETQRQSSLKTELENQYWRSLGSDTARQAYAGAAGIAEQGEARVANIARQKQIEEREKLVSAGLATINQLELTNDDRMDIIFGNKPTSPRAKDLRADFHTDIENQSASIRSAFEHMPQFMIHTLIEDLDMTSGANGDAIAETKRSETVGQLKKRKPLWVSQTILNKMEEGTLSTDYRGKDGTNRMIKENVFDARAASAKALTTVERDDLNRVNKWIHDNKAYINANPEKKQYIQDELIRVYKTNEYAGALEKRINELDTMWLEIGLDADKSKYTVRDGEVIRL